MRPSSRAVPALLAGLFLVLLTAGCRGDSTEPTGAELAERWLRLGEDVGTGVIVYERALPPLLVDLLNPTASDDASEDDLIRLPVHPAGELLGSYVLRRANGSYLLWLFYDVANAEVGGVTSDVSGQLDESPWQVVGQQGNRAYTVVQFQSTRGDDVSGTAIVEPGTSTSGFEVVVDRDGSEVRLEVERAASVPVLEADLQDDLTVRSTQAGLARAAGLQADDRVVSVGGTPVTNRQELDRALAALGEGPGPVGVTYLLQIAPARTPEAASYVPREDLSLPEGFPLRDALTSLTVDQYQTFLNPTGDFYGASLLTEETTSVVSARMRDALAADNWEIVSDQPLGFATALEFVNDGGTLQGSMQIDLFSEDESFAQVVVQIQTAQSGG